jgi:hypothetical protein
VSVSKRKRRVRYARLAIALGLVVWGSMHSGRASAAVHSFPPEAAQGHIVRAVDPAAGRVLGGMTSQHWPVIMTLSGNEKSMDARVALDMGCTSGNDWTAPDGWSRISVPANGKVNVSQAVRPYAGSGGSVSITGGLDSLSGKLNRKRGTFSGVWELQLNFASSNGQTDSCDSGRVSFSVRL